MTQNQNKMQKKLSFIGKNPGKRKVKLKPKKKKVKKVLTKKVWVIQLKKQWWEYDEYSFARDKLKVLLNAGVWHGKIDFKIKEVKK